MSDRASGKLGDKSGDKLGDNSIGNVVHEGARKNGGYYIKEKR